MQLYCLCLCHGGGKASVFDPLEAAVAQGCTCLHRHVYVFLAEHPPATKRWASDATGDGEWSIEKERERYKPGAREEDE